MHLNVSLIATSPNFPVSEGLGLDRDDVRVFLLALRYLRLVGRHVELRRPLPAHDAQPLLRRGLELATHAAVLVLGLDVQNVLHVELEGLGAAGADDARALVNFETASGCREGKMGSIVFLQIKKTSYYYVCT